MTGSPKSLEEKAAARNPEMLRLANSYLDYIEAGDYCNAIETYYSMFYDSEDTSHEGILSMTSVDDDVAEVAHMCLGYAMMLRQ